MLDIQSIVIYLGLALLSFVIGRYAEQRNSKTAVWIIVVLLSLVSGLRAISVGIDTKTYDAVFNLISNGTIQEMYGIEKSFIYISAFLLHTWENTNFLLSIFAFLSHGLILFRIWKYREYISFSWSVFSYYVMFFAFSLNGLRQFIAVAIVIYATGVLKEGKYIRFILLTLIATLFHTSAFIGIAYLFFEILFTKYYNFKRKIIVYSMIGLGSVLGIAAVYNLVNLYSKYFEQQSSSMGYMMIAKFIMLFLTFILIETPQEREERYFFLSHRWYYFVGLLLNSLDYIFLYMGRIGLYFYVIEAIYMGYIFKAKNKTVWTALFKLGYILILLYYLYNNITKGAQGEIPYRFFWQS